MPEPSSTFEWVFAKGGYTYGTRVKVINDTPIFKAGMVEAAGYNGAGQGLTLISERRLELSGTIMADTQEGLRTARDTFMRYHQHGPVDKFIMHGDRWIWGAIDGPIPFKVRNQRIWEWEAQIICADPFYYSYGLKTQSLTNTEDDEETTTIDAEDVGGNAFATPYITFTVDAIESAGVSFIEISNGSDYIDAYQYRQQLFRFYPRTNGTYTVYFGPNCTSDPTTNRKYRHRVIHNTEYAAVNKYRRDTGEILLVPDMDNRITVTLDGIGINGSIAMNWYSRFV